MKVKALGEFVMRSMRKVLPFRNSSPPPHIHREQRIRAISANPFLVDPHPKIAERPTTVNNFMTEQSTSLNGWIAGAIVSGTAGLAMLAASFRKAPVTVEV